MANYKLYEFFGSASGNDDFLSDIGNTWETRRGMFAWTPYSVDDGDAVMNEEFSPRPDSSVWDIRANKEYATKMANAAAQKLGIGGLKYLGMGENGIAFEIDNEKIFKLTTDLSEADAASKLIRAKPKYLAKTYGLYKVIDTEHEKQLSAYVILQENIKEKPLEKFRRYNEIFNEISPNDKILEDIYTMLMKPKKFDEAFIIDCANKILTEKPELGFSERERKETHDYVVGLLNIRNELLSFGIKSNDYTVIDNLGYKNGILTYFDYGGYYNVPEPNIGNNIIYLPEDGSSKFSTDDALGQDEFPVYDNNDTSPMTDNNIPTSNEDLEYRHASDATKDEYVIDETGKKAWMPGAQAVSVKRKCQLGGLGNTSAACNQGDINNLELKKISEGIDYNKLNRGVGKDEMLSTLDFPLKDLTVSKRGIFGAIQDIKQGKLSQTNEPVLVFYNIDKQKFLVEDGYHRVAQAYLNKETTIPVNIYSDMWSDYVANVSDDNKFVLGEVANTQKYYRAVEKNMGKNAEFEPEGFYEAIDDSGSPVWKYDTFWISDKPEVAASKSIGGAVMGLYSMFLQHNKNPEVFYIYEISEKPDVDISHWDIGDFAHLKEVRYRRPVQGTYKGKVTITDDMKKRLRAFYEMTGLDAYDEPNEEYSEVFQDTDYEKFIDGVKSMVRENKQFSGKAYRVDSMFSNKDATAGDVVRYERDELENVDDFAHITDKKLAELDKYPAKKIIWVTKTFEDAKRYSNEPDFSDIDEFDLSGEVIGEDGDGGYLVLIKNNVSEEIDAKEAYTDNGALRTVLNGKRTVGFIELTKDNIGKVQKYNIGVIPVRMKTGNTIMSIIYRPEGKNKAYRLYEIAKSHGGYLNDKSPDEAREIGRILGYKEATIDEYVRRKYNKIPVLPEPSPDDYDDLSEGQISILQDLPFKNDVEERGGKIYSVGGAVRDDFLGKESKDLDVLITGIPMEELEQLLSKYGRVDAVGKSFGVLKFRAQGGDEIDVAIPRTEKPTGDAGHKAFDVTSDHALPIEKDLERRDFTINAIAKDSEGNIVDPYGGQEDLKNKIIRIVNPEAFSDDPLRMLRAVQFASRFGFKIEPETLRMIQSTADRIREIPPERILTEFDKIVKKGNKLTGAILLKSTGLLREIFGKDAGLLMGQNIWENAKTMGEFIWLLSHNLVENPAEFLKNNLKGDIDAYKEIKALQMAFDSGEATNMIEARAVASNMYLTSPQSLQSQILPAVIKTAAQELLQGKYPKSVNELAINGNDLMQLGLKGKEIGDMQKSILLKVYANKIRNNREDLLALAGQNNNVIKEEISDRVEYGCLMLFLDVPIWERITSKIRPEDLYIGGGEYGVEKEPHLTILYGFHDEVTAEDVFDLVKEKIPMRPIQVRITGISIFENLEFDVVKFDVNSPELTKLNDILRQLPNTTKFPEYHAHITIAYVKPGEGKKYIKPFQNEHMLKGDELVFTWKGHRGKEGGEVLKLSEVGALAETYPENKYVVNTQQLKVNYLLKKYDEWNNYNEKYIDPSRETVEEFIQQQFPDLIHDRKLKLDLYWALTDREVLNEIV